MARSETQSARPQLQRLAWTLDEAAEALGKTPAALRRQCERAAVDKPDGRRVARLEFGIIAVSMRRRGRWRFRFPLELALAGADGGENE